MTVDNQIQTWHPVTWMEVAGQANEPKKSRLASCWAATSPNFKSLSCSASEDLYIESGLGGYFRPGICASIYANTNRLFYDMRKFYESKKKKKKEKK